MMLFSIVRELKTWFSYVRKIPGDRGFYFLLTVPDFAYISVNHRKSGPDSPDIEFGGKWKSAPKIEICTQMCDRETGAQQFRGLGSPSVGGSNGVNTRATCTQLGLPFLNNSNPF